MKTAADIARIAKASNVSIQQIEAEIEAYADRKANAAAARAVQYSARTVSSVLDLSELTDDNCNDAIPIPTPEQTK